MQCMLPLQYVMHGVFLPSGPFHHCGRCVVLCKLVTMILQGAGWVVSYYMCAVGQKKRHLHITRSVPSPPPPPPPLNKTATISFTASPTIAGVRRAVAGRPGSGSAWARIGPGLLAVFVCRAWIVQGSRWWTRGPYSSHASPASRIAPSLPSPPTCTCSTYSIKPSHPFR